jgi:HD-like signal output (HDOD) protein
VQHSLDDIRNELLEAIKGDVLVLPTMPEVALRLREVAEDENSNVQSIAKVIGNDAALTARIIRIANSPLVRGVQTVEDLQMAVSRMGMEYTANLAIGIAMEQLFQATSDAVDERMRKTWAHSTDVASMSHVLCQHFTKLKPDQATLAGLIHEIGKLPFSPGQTITIGMKIPSMKLPKRCTLNLAV